METWFNFMIILFIGGISLNDGAKWAYTGEKGASKWGELFPEACSGRHQSPIDIQHEQTTYNADLKDFAIWYDPPKKDSKMYIKNNGHTVQVDLHGDFYVTNGGLSHVYKGLQFHYHWGSENNDNHGSEHLFDGQAFPIEMHLVTYNYEKFSAIGEAVEAPGGLAVLGTMFELSDEDNPALATIVKALKHVRDPDLHEKVELPLMSLRDFLPKDISRYYRYNGSLTTPGCFESVIWTVFLDKQTISLAQLREFKKLLQHKRLVKKISNHEDYEVDRHRRSVRNHNQRMKMAVRGVLDELGIRGNKFQEAIFRSELQNAKLMTEDSGEDIVFRKKRDNSDDVIEDRDDKNEKSADEPDEIDDVKDEKVDKDDAVEHDRHDEDDGHNEEHDRHDEHDKHNKHDGHNDENPTFDKAVEEVVDVAEEVYTQDTMVDNFRPVQPLNDRVVYRSFEHKVQVKDNDDDDNEKEDVQIDKYRSNEPENENDDAISHKINLLSFITAVLLTVMFL